VSTTITGAIALDIRFPTSSDLSGSDAMNEAPDYSAAYVILETDTGLEGHGPPSPSGGAMSYASPP
jgi:L-fuconate dehydratase